MPVDLLIPKLAIENAVTPNRQAGESGRRRSGVAEFMVHANNLGTASFTARYGRPKKRGCLK
jgi:hypothetical protein